MRNKSKKNRARWGLGQKQSKRGIGKKTESQIGAGERLFRGELEKEGWKLGSRGDLSTMVTTFFLFLILFTILLHFLLIFF